MCLEVLIHCDDGDSMVRSVLHHVCSQSPAFIFKHVDLSMFGLILIPPSL